MACNCRTGYVFYPNGIIIPKGSLRKNVTGKRTHVDIFYINIKIGRKKVFCQAFIWVDFDNTKIETFWVKFMGVKILNAWISLQLFVIIALS